MSFAPKKEGRGKSPESHKKSTATIQESPLSIQGRNTSIDGVYTNRLDVLESHLSRISNQQDALLPLMGMLDMAPNVNKNDNLLKSLQKKSQETDEKILKMEQLLKGYQTNVDASLQKIANVPKMPNFDAGLFERNIKMINGQVNDHQNTIKTIENNFNAFQQSIEARIDDEADNTMKVMESKLEKQRSEFTVAINELKKTINETLKKLDEALKEFYLRSERYDEFIQNNNRQRTLEEIQELIAAKFQEQFEFFRDKYDRDLDNLYREFGILRSEMDITNDEKRQAKMAPHIQSLPKDAAPTEKKIKINNVEQALNICITDELEKFNKDNTQRIMYELQAFDEKLDSLKSRYVALKAKNKTADPNKADLGDELNKLKEEMDIINEKYFGLKYQIEGAYKINRLE